MVFHRVEFPADTGWQFPQGGAHPARKPEEELYRELREEIGTDRLKILRRSDTLYAYDFPADARKSHPGFRGQKHWWYLCRLETDVSAIHFNNQPAEFDAWKWVEPAEALARIAGFKRTAYREALADLGLVAMDRQAAFD